MYVSVTTEDRGILTSWLPEERMSYTISGMLYFPVSYHIGPIHLVLQLNCTLLCKGYEFSAVRKR